MNAEEKIGCISVIVICVIVVFAAGFCFIDTVSYNDIKGRCLECGYIDHVVHNGTGYCLRIENGTEVVVPADEACPRRAEQGRGKPE